MTDRITHAPGCWGWGPRHYECALREIELLVAEWKRVTAAQGEAKARAERLAEVLSKILENEASDWKAAEAFGGYVLDDELREEARAALAKENSND